MSGGFRSRTGFWFGGLSGEESNPTGGWRSRIGFWLGGLSASGTPAADNQVVYFNPDDLFNYVRLS